jgi:hypothetical protein
MSFRIRPSNPPPTPAVEQPVVAPASTVKTSKNSKSSKASKLLDKIGASSSKDAASSKVSKSKTTATDPLQTQQKIHQQISTIISGGKGGIKTRSNDDSNSCDHF